MYVLFAIVTLAILSAAHSARAQMDVFEISPAQSAALQDIEREQLPIATPYALSGQATRKAFEVIAEAKVPSYLIDFIGMPPTKIYYLSSIQCVRKGFKEYECDALEPSLKAASAQAHRMLYRLLSDLPSEYTVRSIDSCLVSCPHSFYVTRTLFSDRAQRYLSLKCAEQFASNDKVVRSCEISAEL